MAVRPKQYQLVSGPYRTTVWSILARFKEELVMAAAQRFSELGRQDRKDVLTNAIEALRVRQKWFRSNKLTYRNLLEVSIQSLVAAQPEEWPKSRIASIADRRVEHIDDYLDHVIELWRKCSAPTGNRATFFSALAQTIWPYYCVAYQNRRMAGTRTDMMCTWMPSSRMLGNPCFSSASARANEHAESWEWMLCPTLDAYFDKRSTDSSGRLTEDARDMRSLMDVASHHHLDFESIENNLGHIQQLVFDCSTKYGESNTIEPMVKVFGDDTKLNNPGDIAEALNESRSHFTDLFHFTHEAARLVLTDPNRSGAEKSRPLGVLFLSSPALTCISKVFEGLEPDARHPLKEPIAEAWKQANGKDFAHDFHTDFELLRDQFSDLNEDIRATAATDIAHHSKTLVNNLGGLISLAQKRIADPPALSITLHQASSLASYLGMEFGLKERLQAEIRDASKGVGVALRRLNDEELAGLVRLVFEDLLTYRQTMDSDEGRDYLINGEQVNPMERPSYVIHKNIRSLMLSAYERLGDQNLVERIRSHRNLGLEKVPLALVMFFICREIADNMRPRDPDHANTQALVRISEVVDGELDGWRTIEISQSLAGYSGRSPFGNAVDSASIERLNRRFAAPGMELARITAEEKTPKDGVSAGQLCLVHRISFPPSIGELPHGSKAIGRPD